MNAVTFTETRPNGVEYFPYQHSSGSSSHQRYRSQQHRKGSSSSSSPNASSKKEASGDGAMIIDCIPLCQKLGLENTWARELWFVKDICGLMCAVLTWLLLVYAEFVLMVVVLQHYSWPYDIINAVIYNFFAFLALASHIRVMFTDPGAVPKGNGTPEKIQELGLKEGEVVYRCPRCICIKPDRAHHCSLCQRCIRKMDHHCPWVNNCIGQNNQKYFMLFSVYICLICCHALVLTFLYFTSCFSKPPSDWKDSRFSPLITMLFLISLLFESIIFGIFTASMFHSQMSAVVTDETGIEQLKKETARWEKKPWWLSIKSVFGHPFSWRWFSPFITPRLAYSFADLHTV